MRENTPALTFRVYPGNKRGLYFTVVIFKTLTELRHYAKHTNGAAFSLKRCLGLCMGWTQWYIYPNKKRVVTREMGEIILCTKHCGARIVAHECVHAMLRWAERKGIDSKWLRGEKNAHKRRGLCNDYEEDMAHAVGGMSSQIYKTLYDRKLIN